MLSSTRALVLGVALALGAASSRAHDFWIDCAPGPHAIGAPMAVHLRVGDQLPGEPVQRNPKRIVRFIAAGPDGSTSDIVGEPGADPAGTILPSVPGVHIIAFQSNNAFVELDASHFEEHLRETGLEKISDARAAAGQSDQPVRERYSRCAKSLTLVGDGAPLEGFDRVIGLPLEITPESNPLAVEPGGAVVIRLDHRSAPCAGALVVVKCAADPGHVQRVRTDAEGRAKVEIDAPGAWFLYAVEMIPAARPEPGSEEHAADWESMWASLTFHVPEKGNGR